MLHQWTLGTDDSPSEQIGSSTVVHKSWKRRNWKHKQKHMKWNSFFRRIMRKTLISSYFRSRKETYEIGDSPLNKTVSFFWRQPCCSDSNGLRNIWSFAAIGICCSLWSVFARDIVVSRETPAVRLCCCPVWGNDLTFHPWRDVDPDFQSELSKFNKRFADRVSCYEILIENEIKRLQKASETAFPHITAETVCWYSSINEQFLGGNNCGGFFALSSCWLRFTIGV